MAPSRGTSFLLGALAVSSLLLFAFNYQRLLLGVSISFLGLHGLDAAEENLAIVLHPNDHVLRDPKTILLYWNITKGYRSPDGVRKLVYLINDVFPGPTIEARSGDILIVEVSNFLGDEDVSIHWHGLHMKGANEMDGAVGITQNAIPSGTNFTYKFKIASDQAGTFWYHSHFEIQRGDGLFGGLIVHKPLDNGFSEAFKHYYDDEFLIMVGDWYHRDATEVQASYVNHDSWGREPVPDSLLINGRGAFNCSMAVLSRPLDCVMVQSPKLLQRHLRSRFRVINVGAMSGITLAIPSSHMTVFQVDGGNEVNSTPRSLSVGILYPGERIDMIVEGPRNDGTEPILTIILDTENYSIQNKALTTIHNFRISSNSKLGMSKRGHPYHPPSMADTEGFLDLSTLNGTKSSPNYLPIRANQEILIYTKMEVLAHLGNVPAGFINRTSWAPQSSPSKPLVELPRSDWDRNQLVPWIPISKDQSEEMWVDIVVNNLDEKGHPFHLHGYDFYLLAQYYPPSRGYHAFNPFSTQPPKGGPLNILDPRKKDTVYIPAQGYVVLRIKADNLGIWFFHCHVLWHSGTGMAMGFQVGFED